MPAATDAQVQRYCDERIRPRAEQLIRLLNALSDDAAAIPDVWERAANGDPWSDGRTDGPPALAETGDILAYNTFIQCLVKVVNGTADAGEVANVAANWPVVRTMAVHGLQV